jgi:hypothetical protein
MNPLMVAVIALAVVGALLLYRSSKAQDSADEAVIEQLRAAGSDLSQPHPLEFYVYVPTEESAKRVAVALSREGLQVEVKTAALGPGWLALASKTLVPTSKHLPRLGSCYRSSPTPRVVSMTVGKRR